MNRSFTLVEMLVVLAIMGMVGIATFVNVKSSREESNLKTVVSDLQSYLRLAQANAQTGVKCGSEGGASWSLVIKDRSLIELRCQNQALTDSPIRSWIIKNPARIDSVDGIQGTTSCNSSLGSQITIISPITVIFSYLDGKATFSDGAPAAGNCLLNSQKMVIKVKKNADSQDQTIKTVTISKGGSIDVSQ